MDYVEDSVIDIHIPHLITFEQNENQLTRVTYRIFQNVESSSNIQLLRYHTIVPKFHLMKTAIGKLHGVFWY